MRLLVLLALMAGATTGLLQAADLPAAQSPPNAPLEGDMPAFPAVLTWLNSAPLTREQLRGKVVVVDFWTYSCINCLRATPYINAWYSHYKSSGLVIVGVHSPEFGFEQDLANVLDGKPPVADHGTDADAKGAGTVSEHRLYQLIRQQGDVREHEFGIEFLDPGVEAYSFTFG